MPVNLRWSMVSENDVALTAYRCSRDGRPGLAGA